MWMLIDDVRAGENFDIVVRTPALAKRMIRTLYEDLTCICFDHDLGFDMTGYHVLVWAIDNSYLPNRVELITSNPVGRVNMRAALLDAGYYPDLSGLVLKKIRLD